MGYITLTKQGQDLEGAAPQGASAPEIEVTRAMIAAGVYAAREHCLGEGLEDLVSKVYLAMALET